MPEPRFDWTDASEQDLRQLWTAERRSSAECADELMQRYGGVLTRSAIAGKCKRLGIQRGEEGRPPCRTMPRAPRVRVPRAATARARAPLAPRAEPVPPPAPIEPLRIPFLALEPQHCRWPIGDPREPGFACCGVDRVTARIGARTDFDPACFYCAFHRQLGRQ